MCINPNAICDINYFFNILSQFSEIINKVTLIFKSNIIDYELVKDIHIHISNFNVRIESMNISSADTDAEHRI